MLKFDGGSVGIKVWSHLGKGIGNKTMTETESSSGERINNAGINIWPVLCSAEEPLLTNHFRELLDVVQFR